MIKNVYWCLIKRTYLILSHPRSPRRSPGSAGSTHRNQPEYLRYYFHSSMSDASLNWHEEMVSAVLSFFAHLFFHNRTLEDFATKPAKNPQYTQTLTHVHNRLACLLEVWQGLHLDTTDMYLNHIMYDNVEGELLSILNLCSNQKLIQVIKEAKGTTVWWTSYPDGNELACFASSGYANPGTINFIMFWERIVKEICYHFHVALTSASETLQGEWATARTSRSKTFLKIYLQSAYIRNLYNIYSNPAPIFYRHRGQAPAAQPAKQEQSISPKPITPHQAWTGGRGGRGGRGM